MELWHVLRKVPKAWRALLTRPPGWATISVGGVLAIVVALLHIYFHGAVLVAELVVAGIAMPLGLVVGHVLAGEEHPTDVLCDVLDPAAVRAGVRADHVIRNSRKFGMRPVLTYTAERLATRLRQIADGEYLYIHERDYSKWQSGMLSEMKEGDEMIALCSEKTWGEGFVSDWFDKNLEAAKVGVKIERGLLELWQPFLPAGVGPGTTGCPRSAQTLLQRHHDAALRGIPLSGWTIPFSSPNRDQALQVLRSKLEARHILLGPYFGLVIFKKRTTAGPQPHFERAMLIHWKTDSEMHGVVILDERTIDQCEEVVRLLRPFGVPSPQ